MMLNHDKLKSMVSRASDLTQEGRELSERDRDYYDSYQWTAEEEAILRRRKQPILVKNRIKRKVDAMVGLEQRGRVDPVAYPRNPGDEQAADIATKALRYVEEVERVDVQRSASFYNLAIEGYGGCEIIAEERGGKMEVCVKRLRWEEIFFDPHSRELDFSDASFIGVQKWMDEGSAISYARKFYEGSEDDLRELMDTQATDVGETYSDRPYDNGMAWVDKKMRRVRIAQMYYRVGDDWYFTVFTGRGELYNGPSPYLDEDGKPTCAMILMSAYIDRENMRYGVVRDMISAQDEVNKRSSKLLHLLNSRQTVGVKGAVDSVAGLKRELASPDGHVELNVEAFEYAIQAGVKPFEIVTQTDTIAGQASLLTEAKQEIDMVGPNASLLGQLDGNQSGRAIMAQQQAGLAELSPLYDGLRDWTERVYRAIWNRIRQFWDGPRWIRITDEDQAPQFIGVNQPVMTEMGPMVQNPIAQIDVDIIVSSSPEFVTLRHEQFEKLSDLAAKGYPIPPEVLLEASDLKDKKKLLDAIKGAAQVDPQQAAMQQQMQMEAFQREMGVKAAKEKRDTAAAIKDIASIENDMAKTQISAADTRLKAISATQPQRVA